MSKGFAIVAFLCFACAVLCAQSPPSTEGSDIDNLFNGSGSGSESSQIQKAGPGEAPTVRPDDITRDNKLHFFGSLDIYGDLGGGWSEIPDLTQLGSNLGQDLTLLGSNLGPEAGGSLTASLGFEVRPATELRIRGKLSFYFPAQTYLFSEMIVDYSILNSVFFRVGIFDYTWGNSQFFQFGNLPARSLPSWGLSSLPFWERTNILTAVTTPTVPISVKINIPFGLNGLTFLVRFDMTNYFPGQTTPNPKDAGYGLEYDLVTGPIEWSIAGFYQYLLTPRSLLAMKTSILGFDISAEMTMAYPGSISPAGFVSDQPTGGGIYVGGVLQRIYPTAVIGLSREWTDAHIKLYAEYAYNGERDPGTNWLPRQDQTGPGGHNSAIALRFSNLGASGGLTFNLLWQQNWSDGSGLIGPFLQLSPVALTTIQIGLPFVYGPDNGEVLNNRLTPGSKRLELLFLVKLNASFQQ